MTRDQVQLRIGVLDDDRSVAEITSQCLVHMGHIAVPYFSVPSMLSDLARRQFNAYLLDWTVGAFTVRELIAAVRAVDGDAPIAVLSGHIGIDDLVAAHIALSAKELRFLTFEKPTRIPHIAAALLSAAPAACRTAA